MKLSRHHAARRARRHRRRRGDRARRARRVRRAAGPRAAAVGAQARRALVQGQGSRRRGRGRAGLPAGRAVPQADDHAAGATACWCWSTRRWPRRDVDRAAAERDLPPPTRSSRPGRASSTAPTRRCSIRRGWAQARLDAAGPRDVRRTEAATPLPLAPADRGEGERLRETGSDRDRPVMRRRSATSRRLLLVRPPRRGP